MNLTRNFYNLSAYNSGFRDTRMVKPTPRYNH
jgi:hypothetical protein